MSLLRVEPYGSKAYEDKDKAYEDEANKLEAFEQMKQAEEARLQALKEAARLQALKEAARLQALKEAEEAARLQQEAEAAAVPRKGPYLFPLKSLPTSDSLWVSSVVYKINTHGWTIVSDKNGNPRYYTVPEGKRACIFSSVIGGLTSINEPVIVKMLSDEVDKFIAIFPTKTPGPELNQYIQQFQYETVSKIAEMIIPELIYLIEYYLGLLKWHEDNPAEPKKAKDAEKDIKEINKMLYDLKNYSEELLSRPENFMVGVVYNARELIKEKAYQTDTTLLKAGINEEDWNTQEIFGPKVLSSTLKPVETDRDESTNTTYIFPKDSTKNPVFGNMTSKGKTKTFDATTSQMLTHAFLQAPLALVFDNSCFEILSSDRRLIQNFDIIEDLRKEIASLDNRIQMTPSQSDAIKVAIRKITGIPRVIDGKQDNSLTRITLLGQLAKLNLTSVFMEYYTKVTTEKAVAVAATKPKKKKGGKRKTLKKYGKKMSQKKRHLSKNKGRKTKRK